MLMERMNKRNDNMSEKTVISAKEFSGGLESEKKSPIRRGRIRAGKSKDDLLAELKLKMVMRIYNVSRARTAAIIADRDDERQALKEVRETARDARRVRRLHGDGPMAAEDFFGA